MVCCTQYVLYMYSVRFSVCGCNNTNSVKKSEQKLKWFRTRKSTIRRTPAKNSGENEKKRMTLCVRRELDVVAAQKAQRTTIYINIFRYVDDDKAYLSWNKHTFGWAALSMMSNENKTNAAFKSTLCARHVRAPRINHWSWWYSFLLSFFCSEFGALSSNTIQMK